MVKALPKLFLLLAFLCATFAVSAQLTNITLNTFVDTPVSATFLSANIPDISEGPLNGTATITETGIPFQYEITYTPDLGYEGTNSVTIYRFPLELPSLVFNRYIIHVSPVILNANRDFAQTSAGVDVMIPVLENDYSSNGFFELRAAPTTNSGTTEIIGDQVRFTPDPGFVGLTDFNYLICSHNDFCILGTVSVNVQAEDGQIGLDTIAVFTKKGKPQIILAPDNYQPISIPQNGTFDASGDVPVYQPNAGFVGLEYLSFDNGNGSILTFEVEVLDLKDNGFAVEDMVYTSIDAPVRINVLENDLFGSFTGCISYGSPAFGSLTQLPGQGRLSYTPPANWGGVDRFTYTSFPPGCIGESETETVYIVVSDFVPEVDEITISTTSGTSIPITYEVPTGDYVWTLDVPPTLGTVTNGPNGQLYYTPTVAGGLDQLTITYCLEDMFGLCASSKTVDITISITAGNGQDDCNEDCVWPGDTNNDGVVDMGDLLPIGLHMGSYGTPRLTAEPALWCPQESEDWEDAALGVDLKHVDANGDQIVSSLDTLIVRQNLGLASRLRPRPQNFSAFDVILDGDIFAEPGDIVEIGVHLGSTNVVVEDLVGFILPFEYDPTVIVGPEVDIDFGEDSWFSYDSPILSMKDNKPDLGILNAALTRTSGTPASGHGQVGVLRVVVEDLVGFRPGVDEEITTVVGGADAEVMNSEGHLSSVRVQPFELTIVNRTDPTEELDVSIDEFLDEKLIAFPNPTSDRLTVHMNGQMEFSALQLSDMTGRTLVRLDGLHTNHYNLDLSQLPIGIYSLHITTEKGTVNRKIEVIR